MQSFFFLKCWVLAGCARNISSYQIPRNHNLLFCSPSHSLSSSAGSLIGKMNFEKPNLQHHSHLNGLLLIPGPSLVLANSGRDLKSARALEKKAYENNIHVLSSLRLYSIFCTRLWGTSLSFWRSFVTRYIVNRIIWTWLLTFNKAWCPHEMCIMYDCKSFIEIWNAELSIPVLFPEEYRWSTGFPIADVYESPLPIRDWVRCYSFWLLCVHCIHVSFL